MGNIRTVRGYGNNPEHEIKLALSDFVQEGNVRTCHECCGSGWLNENDPKYRISCPTCGEEGIVQYDTNEIPMGEGEKLFVVINGTPVSAKRLFLHLGDALGNIVYMTP